MSPLSRAVSRLLWGLTLVVAGLAGLGFLVQMAMAESAPQQAAAGAMACATVVIPYVFARAWDFMLRPPMDLPSAAAAGPALSSIHRRNRGECRLQNRVTACYTAATR